MQTLINWLLWECVVIAGLLYLLRKQGYQRIVPDTGYKDKVLGRRGLTLHLPVQQNVMLCSESSKLCSNFAKFLLHFCLLPCKSFVEI